MPIKLSQSLKLRINFYATDLWHLSLAQIAKGFEGNMLLRMLSGTAPPIMMASALVVHSYVRCLVWLHLF